MIYDKADWGYEVDYVDQIMTSMQSSKRRHTCYFYLRRRPLAIPSTIPFGSSMIKIPARPGRGHEEVETSVICANEFLPGVCLATGTPPPQSLLVLVVLQFLLFRTVLLA